MLGVSLQDYYNLVDVYLDAVLHPNCIKDPGTFAQEGWHHELEDPKVSSRLPSQRHRGPATEFLTLSVSHHGAVVAKLVTLLWTSSWFPQHLPQHLSRKTHVAHRQQLAPVPGPSPPAAPRSHANSVLNAQCLPAG